MSQSVLFGNLLPWCVQVAVLTVVGTALPALFRLRVPRIMLAYWQGLMALCLLLPAIQPWRASVTLPGLANSTATVRLGAAVVLAPTLSIHISELVLLVIALGVLVRTFLLLLGLRRLSAYRQGAIPLPPEPAIREMESRLGVRAAFYLSEEVNGPATFCLVQPTVLLPASFMEMERSRQDGIACHELLHVARRDWVFNLIEEIILTVLWFHPAIWWLVSRIRLSREQVVDAEVVKCTGARKPYLNTLLAIAAGRNLRAASTAPTLLSENQLAQRIELMVKEVAMSRLRLTASLASMCGMLVLAAGFAVRAFPLKVPAPGTAAIAEQKTIDAGAAEKKEKGITRPEVIYKPEPPYTKGAKDAKIQGVVTLRIAIDTQGNVTDAKVTKSLEKSLDESAVQTVRTWKFKPAMKNGKPIPYKAMAEVNFKLY